MNEMGPFLWMRCSLVGLYEMGLSVDEMHDALLLMRCNLVWMRWGLSVDEMHEALLLMRCSLVWMRWGLFVDEMQPSLDEMGPICG